MSAPTIKRIGETHEGHPRYEVTKDGVCVGYIEGYNPTFERRSRGKRYVNARWKSKRRYWRTCRANGSTMMWTLETIKRALRDFES